MPATVCSVNYTVQHYLWCPPLAEAPVVQDPHINISCQCGSHPYQLIGPAIYHGTPLPWLLRCKPTDSWYLYNYAIATCMTCLPWLFIRPICLDHCDAVHCDILCGSTLLHKPCQPDLTASQAQPACWVPGGQAVPCSIPLTQRSSSPSCSKAK